MLTSYIARKTVIITLCILLYIVGAQAQAPRGTLPPHGAILTWVAGANTTASNVYRCPGTCTASSGVFTVLNAAPLTAVTYNDSPLSANTTYSWCVTGLVTLSSGPFETACSVVVTATVPKDAAGVPGGVVVTVQ